MKKLIIIVCIILLTHSFLVADEYPIYSGIAISNRAGNYDRLISYTLKYISEIDLYEMRVNNPYVKGQIFLSEQNIETLRYVLDKYLDWIPIAIENNIRLRKEITNSRITTKVKWTFGDHWYSSEELVLQFTFFSFSETDHQLVISSNAVRPKTGLYTDMYPFVIESMSIVQEEAERWREGISVGAVRESTQNIRIWNELFR